MNIETLLFTGFSAAGKSTIARRFAEDYGFVLLEERGILHELAVVQGFNRTREWIIQEGEEVVLQAARSRTISRMKEVSGEWGVVIDGTYDRYLPLVIRETFPSFRITIVSVLLDDQEREKRMVWRLNKHLSFAKKEMALIDGFKIRAGIEDIMKIADINIENSFGVKDSLKSLFSKLESLGINPLSCAKRQ